MKCLKCGTEFEEGVFCPECGNRVISEDTNNTLVMPTMSAEDREHQLQVMREKTEQERLALERANAARDAQAMADQKDREHQLQLMRERTEQERLATERVAADREKAMAAKQLERERIALEREKISQTESEKRELINFENRKIDGLKSALMATKSQDKRREIFYAFNDQLETFEARGRYQRLKDKVDIEEPQSIKVKKIYGSSIIAAFTIFWVGAIVWSIITKGANTPIVIDVIGTILFLHWFFGGIIWIVWSVIEGIKRKMKGHYLYIADI